jgi:hypothetical protein
MQPTLTEELKYFNAFIESCTRFKSLAQNPAVESLLKGDGINLDGGFKISIGDDNSTTISNNEGGGYIIFSIEGGIFINKIGGDNANKLDDYIKLISIFDNAVDKLTKQSDAKYEHAMVRSGAMERVWAQDTSNQQMRKAQNLLKSTFVGYTEAEYNEHPNYKVVFNDESSEIFKKNLDGTLTPITDPQEFVNKVALIVSFRNEELKSLESLNQALDLSLDDHKRETDFKNRLSLALEQSSQNQFSQEENEKCQTFLKTLINKANLLGIEEGDVYDGVEGYLFRNTKDNPTIFKLSADQNEATLINNFDEFRLAYAQINSKMDSDINQMHEGGARANPSRGDGGNGGELAGRASINPSVAPTIYGAIARGKQRVSEIVKNYDRDKGSPR